MNCLGLPIVDTEEEVTLLLEEEAASQTPAPFVLGRLSDGRDRSFAWNEAERRYEPAHDWRYSYVMEAVVEAGGVVVPPRVVQDNAN